MDGWPAAGFRPAVNADGRLDMRFCHGMGHAVPRVLFDAAGGWVLRASAQIPLSDSGLNGTQDEKIVVNPGVTRLFKP